MHAVHQLYQERLARSTRPFLARGGRVDRCPQCRLAKPFCTCGERPSVASNAAFRLLMYDDEVLKPSNSGRLVADIVPDTFAFIWSRTQPDARLLALLADPLWQPCVVFPASYASPGRTVWHSLPPLGTDKRPLFILIDGSWREACKIFRKSPYLDSLPMLSFSPDSASRYQVRTAAKTEQLATAEVAARVLEMAGEPHNAAILDAWFDLFAYRYQLAVHQINRGHEDALARLRQALAEAG